MPIDTFDTAVLNKVVERLDRPSSFLLDMFFPMTQEEPDSEEIHFDIDQSKPRISPFVSPLVAGKIVADQGFATKSFKPAYVKDKRRFNPNRPLKRVIGEKIGGALTAAQRMDAAVKGSLVDQIDMLTRRETLMAAETLLTGKCTIVGDLYPAVVVDFLRDVALTVTLGAGLKWGDAGVSPVENLEDWSNLTLAKSGVASRTAVLDPLAYKKLRKDPLYKEMLDREAARQLNNLLDGPLVRGTGDESAVYVGKLGAHIDLWVYSEPYVDEAGALQNMMPDNTVIMGARGQNNSGRGGLEGTRCYGMIHDEKSGFKAPRYFAKSWLEEDPAVRYLLLQSAPLMVPYRPNASAAFKVA